MVELDPIRHFLLVFGICIVRMTAACSVVPFLGSSVVQGRIRNSIIFAFGLIIFPIVSPTAPAQMGSVVSLLGIVGKEVIIGILIGFVASKIFWVAMSVGFVIDNQRGASMASVFDPNSGAQTSPFGLLFQQAVIVYFYTGGGFLLFLGVVFESYVIWPVFTFYPNFHVAFPDFALGHIDEVMKLTVVFAAPIVIVVFVAEFGLGLVNRFAPQLNVFFLAMPVKSIVAVLVMILYLPFLFSLFEAEMGDTVDILKFLEAVIT